LKKSYLFATELGIVILDETGSAVSKFPFAESESAAKYLQVASGELSEDELNWVKAHLSSDALLVTEKQLLPVISAAGIQSELMSDQDQNRFNEKKMDILVASELAHSREQAEERLRNISIEISNIRIREQSASPDLQAIQSVQALDEIDKTANIVSSRVREWYGLHFPELTSIIDDNPSLLRLVLRFKTRDAYAEGDLEEMGYSKNKSRAIEIAAKQSRGADLRGEDVSRIVQLAEEAQHLFSLRDKLAMHVERTMRRVAPNTTEIAGATIGARLMSKAGGLEKLAVLPASTIQILGAEKALFRALRSGARPPKHGLLFQHADVHSAPKWQRGKIARQVAGKIAIAARVDKYRGSRDDTVLRSLQSRLNEIRTKYKEPPAPKPEAPSSWRPRPPQFPRREEGERKWGKKNKGKREKRIRQHRSSGSKKS
jgi:nucleolar protein 56